MRFCAAVFSGHDYFDADCDPGRGLAEEYTANQTRDFARVLFTPDELREIVSELNASSRQFLIFRMPKFLFVLMVVLTLGFALLPMCILDVFVSHSRSFLFCCQGRLSFGDDRFGVVITD